MAFGNGHYTRTDGSWFYTLTGEPVPGAQDLRVGHRVVMDAPELHPAALLTIAQAAELAGVKADSWRRMVSRGLAPEPVFRFESTPLWTRPIIVHWKARRPGTGGRRAA